MDALIAALSLVFVVSLALGGPPRFLPPWVALFALSVAALARFWRREKEAGREPAQSRPEMFLFLSCLILYLASFRWHGGDDIPNSVLPFAILRHGTLSFDPLRAWACDPALRELIITVNGRLLSFYPVAPGVLAVPLYIIPALAGFTPSDPFLHNMAKIAGTLITALSVLVLFRALEKRVSRPHAMAAASLYAFGTFAFSVSSQALYSHGPAQLGVAMGLLGILTPGGFGAMFAGFGLGLATVSREDSALFGLAAALYFLFHDRKRLPAFALGALFPIALNLAYWRWYGGSFRPPYHALQARMFVSLDYGALLAMLFSPSRGLLPFMPAAAFGVWGAAKVCRDRDARWAPYFVAACVGTWIFYGFRDSWTGGVTFGTRYFSIAAMLLAFFTAEVGPEIARSPSLRRAWAWTFALSVIIHAVGAFLTWPTVAMTLQEQIATVWHVRLHPLAYLFAPEGPLSMPPPARIVVACGLLALSWPLARFIERRAG